MNLRVPRKKSDNLSRSRTGPINTKIEGSQRNSSPSIKSPASPYPKQSSINSPAIDVASSPNGSLNLNVLPKITTKSR